MRGEGEEPRAGLGRAPHLRDWWPAGVALALLVMGLSIWELFPPGIWHDDGVYVLLGRSLARGEGLRYVGVVGSPLAPKFPPLFPALLAGVWWVFPTFPQNTLLLCSLNLLLLAGAGGLFAAFLHRVLRLSPGLATGIALLAWLSPSLWRTALIPLSEPLFLLLLAASLWSAARMEERPGIPQVLLFLAAAGAAYHARTLGVAVLAGGVGALLLRGRRTASLWALAGATGLLLPWMLWSGAAAAALPPSLRDTLGSYGGWLSGQLLQGPGAFLLFFGANSVHLLGRFLSLLLPGVVGLPLWLGLPLVPICVLGMREAGRTTRTLPIAVGLALVVLALWPFQDVRLLTPFHPFLVLGTVLGFRRLLVLWRGSPWRHRTVAGLGGGWLLVMIPMSLFRLGSGWPGESYRVRAEALQEAVRAVLEKTPPDAVVGAPELWPGIHLFTGRTVVPSAPFHPLSREVPSWGSPQEQFRLWIEAGVTHLLVEDGGRTHGEALDRVDALCPPGTVQLLDMVPGQFLVRLAWDRACQGKVLAPD